MKEKMFRDELLANEEILWTGQPDPSKNFTFGDLFLIPFSIVWAGLFMNQLLNEKHGPPLPFVILFTTVALYLVLGRFVMKKISKRRTYYAVTNERVLVLNTLFYRKLQSEFLNTLSTVNRRKGYLGMNSLTFSNSKMLRSGNMGLDIFNFNNAGSQALAFYDLKDIDKVYNLILEKRGQSKK